MQPSRESILDLHKFASFSFGLAVAELSNAVFVLVAHNEVVRLQLMLIQGADRVSTSMLATRSEITLIYAVSFGSSVLCGGITGLLAFVLFSESVFQNAIMYARSAVIILISWILIVIIFPYALVFNILLAPCPEMRLIEDVPEYRIEYVHGCRGFEDYYLHLVITRNDGAKHLESINFSLHSLCSSLSTSQVGSKVYFLCDEEKISAWTPYVDKERIAIYTGDRSETPKSITDLFLKP